MAVAIRASGPIQNGLSTNVTTASWTIPAAVADGDVAIFALGSNTATGTFSTPSGWSVIGSPTVSSSAYTTLVYAKVLTAAEASTTVSVTLSIAGRVHGGYIILSGAAGLPSIIGQASDTTAGATVAAPTVTPTASNSLIVNFGMIRSATTSGPITVTVDSGGTEQAEGDTAFTAASIPNFACSVATRNTLGSAGTATGAATFTSTDSGSTGQAWTVAVAPAAAATVALVAVAAPAAVSSTATTTAITVPATAAAGQVATLVFEGSDVYTNTAPVDWTKVTSQSKAGICLDIWTKTLVAGDVGATVTITSNNTVNYKRAVQMFVFSGAQAGQVKSTLETATTTTHVTPAVTASDPSAWVLVGVADRASPGSQSWTLPGALTSQAQFFGSGGAGVSGVAATASAVGSGSVGSYTITGTVSTATAAMWSLVIEPTAAVVGGTVSAGPDVQSEPRVSITRTATATGSPTSYSWAPAPGSPTVTLSGANTATVSFTTPPAITQVTYTLQVTATYGNGTTAVDTFAVTVYPVTRRFFALDGTEVPLRVQKFT